MTPLDPIVEAWHDLFRTASIDALTNALRAGAVPEPCVAANGNDLLTTVLCRPLTDLGAPVSHFGGKLLRGNQERLASLEGLFNALLERSDLAPFELQDTSALGSLLAHSTPVDLALAWGLVNPALEMLQHPSAPHGPDLLAWNENLVGQPGTPGRRTQLAVAIGRGQVDLVKWMAWAGVPINQPDVAGETPLFSAEEPSMLKELFALGASLTAHTSKISPVEHWGKLMQGKKDYNTLSLKALVELASQEAGASVAYPVLRLQSSPLTVSAYSYRNNLNQVVDAWEKDWKAVQDQMGSAPLTWVRQQPSGPWKGTVSPLAQVGLNLFNQDELSVVVGQVDLMAWVSQTDPVFLRKGVSDRGLFALGAMRYLGAQALFKSDTSGVLWGHNSPSGCLDQVALVDKGAAELTRLLGQQPQERWHAWMLETSKVIQGPQNLKIRELMSDMWAYRLSLTNPDGSFGFDMPPRIPPAGTISQQLALAKNLMEAGIHLMGGQWLLLASVQAQAIGSLKREEQKSAALDWLTLNLATFLDGMKAGNWVVNDRGHLASASTRRSAHADKIFQAATLVLDAIPKLLPLVEPSKLLANPVLARPILEALPVLERLEGFPPALRAMRLEQTLPAAPRSSKEKPRF